MLFPCRLRTRISTASSATSMRPSHQEYPMPGWVGFQLATRVSFALAVTRVTNDAVSAIRTRRACATRIYGRLEQIRAEAQAGRMKGEDPNSLLPALA